MLVFFYCFIFKETSANKSNKKQITLNYEEKANIKHIVMFHPWSSKSMRMQQNVLLEGLLARGHTVTGVFSTRSKIKDERYIRCQFGPNIRYIKWVHGRIV